MKKKGKKKRLKPISLFTKYANTPTNKHIINRIIYFSQNINKQKKQGYIFFPEY